MIENVKLFLSFNVNKNTGNYDFSVVEKDYDYSEPPETIIVNTRMPWEMGFLFNHLTATGEIEKFLTWFCFYVLDEVCCLGYNTTIDHEVDLSTGWRLTCHRCGNILVDNMLDC